MSYSLKGKEILVSSGAIYESSHWDAPPEREVIAEERFIVHSVVYASRHKNQFPQQPYLYIDSLADGLDSARGIWPHEADLTVL